MNRVLNFISGKNIKNKDALLFIYLGISLFAFIFTIIQRKNNLINHYILICGYAIIIVILGFQIKQIITNINKINKSEIVKRILNFLVRILFLWNLTQLLTYIIDFIFVNKESSNIIVFINFTRFIIIVISLFLSLHFILKYLLKLDYFTMVVLGAIIYLAGWLESRTWEFIALIAVVINMLLNYDDAKILYEDAKENSNKDISFYENRQEHKIKFSYLKLKFNIALVFLYLYIQLSDNIDILGNLLWFSTGDGRLDAFMKVFFKGSDKVLIFLIIINILVLLLKCKWVKSKVDNLIEKLKNNYIKAFERITK